MTVYVLLVWRDFDCEVSGVFDTHAKAISEGQRLDQAGGIQKGSWAVEKHKVQ